jgi:hypothetical protein
MPDRLSLGDERILAEALSRFWGGKEGSAHLWR